MENPPNPSAFDALTVDFVREFINEQNAIKVDAKFMAKGLKELAKATKVDTFKGQVKTQQPVFDDLGQPVFDKEGKAVLVDKAEDVVIYSKPLKDNVTRLKAHTLLLNSRGVPTTSPTHQTNIGQAGEVNIMGAVAQIMEQNGADVED